MTKKKPSWNKKQLNCWNWVCTKSLDNLIWFCLSRTTSTPLLPRQYYHNARTLQKSSSRKSCTMCASDFYGKLWCERIMLLLHIFKYTHTKKDLFRSFASIPDVLFWVCYERTVWSLLSWYWICHYYASDTGIYLLLNLWFWTTLLFSSVNYLKCILWSKFQIKMWIEGHVDKV